MGNAEYPFITITPRSTLDRSSSTWPMDQIKLSNYAILNCLKLTVFTFIVILWPSSGVSCQTWESTQNLDDIIWRLQVQSQQQVTITRNIYNNLTLIPSWLTELEQSTPEIRITGSVQDFLWTPEFNEKHLMKAEGHIDQNMIITIKMRLTVQIFKVIIMIINNVSRKSSSNNFPGLRSSIFFFCFSGFWLDPSGFCGYIPLCQIGGTTGPMILHGYLLVQSYHFDSISGAIHLALVLLSKQTQKGIYN